MTEHSSEPNGNLAPPTGCESPSPLGGTETAQTPRASKPISLNGRKASGKKKLLIGVFGIVILAVVLWFGIPAIRLAFNTASTDDAYVNGHVTFVAARVSGQVSRILVDDNNRVHRGDLLVELDKEPYEDAVAVSRAAVDTAKANLLVAMSTARGLEAEARSRRWKLQNAIEDVGNQVALLRARVAGLDKSKATLALAQLNFERASKLVASDDVSRSVFDQRQADLSTARADVTQALADMYQIRVSLGLPAHPRTGISPKCHPISIRPFLPSGRRRQI